MISPLNLTDKEGRPWYVALVLAARVLGAAQAASLIYHVQRKQ